MTDNTSTPTDEAAQNATLQKAVIVGMQPGQPTRVIEEACLLYTSPSPRD